MKVIWICAFDAIAWVSVGQAPNIMELQRTLFEQLTGGTMPSDANPTAQKQLAALQAGCKGRMFLVVLDDVWEREHEKQLNCIDPSSASKLLVTTRIRGLIQGCDEVSLNLLSPAESVDLLLRTGGIVDADDAAAGAARQITDLCGHLPLYVSIVGSVIQDYDGGDEWQTELLEMLRLDRVGLIDDATDGDGGGMVERVVDT